MKVIVYVEGPSDRLAMQELLAGLLTRLHARGITVNFLSVGNENKKDLMLKTPSKAVNILLNDPQSMVIALPDLYPPNHGFPHATFAELKMGLQDKFKRELERKNVDDARLYERFHVFCFKYDLEALVLAAESQLASRLGVSSIDCTWIKPVEDQNHNKSVFLKSTATAKNLPGSWFKGQKRCAEQVTCPKS
jgi:hypothetical protein